MKLVILDFSGAISNVIPSIQSTVDNLLLYQETVQPLGDLRYTMESYRTGSFIPKVVTYENYYHSADGKGFNTHSPFSFDNTNVRLQNKPLVLIWRCVQGQTGSVSHSS